MVPRNTTTFCGDKVAAAVGDGGGTTCKLFDPQCVLLPWLSDRRSADILGDDASGALV